MAIASSYDSTGRYGAQTPFADQLSDSWVAGKFEVDATHNSLIAVTNAGKKPTEAVLTFNYNRGQDHYEVRRTIAPGDQLWLNLGDIIRNRVPDSKGRIFPPDLTWGTYDIREPNRNNDPSLFEGKIIVDKTYGHLAYGCTTCCGDGYPGIQADPETLAVLAQDTLGVWATNSCTGYDDNLTGLFSGWDTNNHAVAMMSSTQITGVGAGSTNAFASGTFNYNNGVSKYCSLRQAEPQNDTTVLALNHFNILVTSTPITGETNSMVSGQAANVQVQAIDNLGQVFSAYRGTVHFSSTDASATLPSNYTFNSTDAGTHTFSATLKTVSGTTATRDFTVTDQTANVTATDNIYVWWYVFMDVERWKNCNFASCPSLGSYFCQTAYQPSGYPQATSFLAVTYSSSGTLYNRSVTVRYGTGRSSSIIGDAGPVLGQNYWNTGNTPPSTAGCLSDVLATNVGMTNGCNGGTPYGQGNIYWRFGN